jgi:hypothetical protein
MSITMSRITGKLLPAMMLMVIALPGHAAFYKWVDEHGVTQYTQSPPPSGHYQEMRSPAPPSETEPPPQSSQPAPAQQKSTTASAETAASDEKALAKQQAAKRHNCQLARGRLSELENHARIRLTAPDGSVRVMGEAEKQAKLTETRKMIAENCQ